MKKNIGSIKQNGFLYVFEHFIDAYKPVFILLIAAIAIAFPFTPIADRSTQRIVIMILLYAMLGMGLNVLTGYTGLVSLGHAGFYGIGAYCCAILTTKLGWSFWPALLAGGCFTAFIGFLLGLPTLRLSGTYLSIVTLGFCEIVQMILKQWESVTNGNYGIRNIPKPVFFGFECKLQNGGFYFIVLALVVLTALACMAIKKSKAGRAFLAIKDDELAATMMGIKTARYKILSFVISAFITGIAGGFYSVINNGYMVGMSETEFGVNGSLTRGQLVTILYRLAGEPTVEGKTNPFTDVAENRYYTNAVIWGASEGIVNGIIAYLEGK